MRCRIKRIYDPVEPADGLRVLVDRVWPRGVKKADAAIDQWAKDLAPSTELRRWFGHDPARWRGFRRRYLAELKKKTDRVAELSERAGDGNITLLFSARDREHNQAVIIREFMKEFCP